MPYAKIRDERRHPDILNSAERSIRFMPSPQLIVFEGVDAAGKTSICEQFVATLQSRKLPARLASFPGKISGTLGELVYRLHHDSSTVGVERVTPAGLQALHVAAHLDTIEREIVPALEAGQVIVLDRFWWSTWAYGVISGVSPAILKALIDAERIAWGHWKPDALILLTRTAPLRNEPLELWHRLKDEYDTLHRRETGSYPIHRLCNDGPFEDTIAQAVALVDEPSQQ